MRRICPETRSRGLPAASIGGRRRTIRAASAKIRCGVRLPAAGDGRDAAAGRDFAHAQVSKRDDIQIALAIEKRLLPADSRLLAGLAAVAAEAAIAGTAKVVIFRSSRFSNGCFPWSAKYRLPRLAAKTGFAALSTPRGRSASPIAAVGAACRRGRDDAAVETLQ